MLLALCLAKQRLVRNDFSAKAVAAGSRNGKPALGSADSSAEGPRTRGGQPPPELPSSSGPLTSGWPMHLGSTEDASPAATAEGRKIAESSPATPAPTGKSSPAALAPSVKNSPAVLAPSAKGSPAALAPGAENATILTDRSSPDGEETGDSVPLMREPNRSRPPPALEAPPSVPSRPTCRAARPSLSAVPGIWRGCRRYTYT